MTRVAVSLPVLTWALERSGKAEATQRKFPKLGEWLSGKSSPTLRQLEAFAKTTYTPLGYFFLPEPPGDKLPIPLFRTSADADVWQASPDLLETIRMMERRRDWLREYLQEQGAGPLPYVGSFATDSEPESIAADIRRVLGLEAQWASRQRTWYAALAQLRTRVEEAGILVSANGVVGNNTSRKLDPAEFRGFVLVDKWAPLVFLNASDWKSAQMFTLGHELAHIWLGSSAAFDLRSLQPARNRTEQICNKAAAELLVPAQALHSLWPSVRDKPEPHRMTALHFKVSVIVAARRALDLGLVSKSEFLAFYADYTRQERKAARRSQGQGNFYASQSSRIGRRFGAAVVRAAKEGNLLYTEAFALTGLHGRAFDKFAEWLDIGGAE